MIKSLRSVAAACAFLFFTMFLTPGVQAEVRATDQQVVSSLEKIRSTLRSLIASQEHLDRRQKLQAEDIKSLQNQIPGSGGLFSDESFRVLAGKLDRGTLIEILKELSGRQSISDPKAEFMAIVIDRLCKLERDNCRLRKSILDYEDRERQRQMALLRGKVSPVADYSPTPAPPPRQIQQATYYTLHRPSVCCRNRICPSAVLIATNADGMYADGRIEHGDVYLDCNNRQVLVRNMQTRSVRGTQSVLVW